MIISTIEELSIYLPTHSMSNLDAMQGFFDNSQHDFLLDKVGKPLMSAIEKEYTDLQDKFILLPQNADLQSAWHKLIVLCQRAVVFDALMRSADISTVSVNNSGINIVSTGDFENADKDSLGRYKTRCNIEAHSAVNRLLVHLEELAQEFAPKTETTTKVATNESAKVVTNGQTEEPEPEQPIAPAPEAIIVELWRKSRYYYLADGLFINTASKFNEYIDIYDSREKFIQLLPDLRYCQEIILRPELGDALTDDLVACYQTGALNKHQSEAVVKLQRTLALCVESRNKMFKRAEARDEAMMNLRLCIAYISNHQAEFGEAVKTSPFYQPSAAEQQKPEAPGVASVSATPPMIGGVAQAARKDPAEPWKNNRPGNALFISHAIE